MKIIKKNISIYLFKSLSVCDFNILCFHVNIFGERLNYILKLKVCNKNT